MSNSERESTSVTSDIQARPANVSLTKEVLALEEPEQLRRKRSATKRAVTKKIKELTELKLSLRSSSEAKIKAQESGTPERE